MVTGAQRQKILVLLASVKPHVLWHEVRRPPASGRPRWARTTGRRTRAAPSAWPPAAATTDPPCATATGSVRGRRNLRHRCDPAASASIGRLAGDNRPDTYPRRGQLCCVRDCGRPGLDWYYGPSRLRAIRPQIAPRANASSRMTTIATIIIMVATAEWRR
jgi:hypothetical protein